MSIRFFEELPGFGTFQELVIAAHYREVPDDWWVVVTDVVGSTEAIRAGRYKDVNSVGAATLVALKNAIADVQIPFVFGGDGSSAAFPGIYREAVTRELSALKTLSAERFGLELRVGLVAAQELRERGAPLRVAKYLLDGGYPLALFRGGALRLAEELIKSTRAHYEIPTIAGATTDLLALSCRWLPLTASRGCALAILAMEPSEDSPLMEEFLSGIDRILHPQADPAGPVQVSDLAYRGLRELWLHDGRFAHGAVDRLWRRTQSFVAWLLFKLKLGRLLPRLRRYVAATPAHSDSRKFDDMLRMVIDCSPDQADAIEALCQELRARGGLAYGLHRSQAFLMTCYVPGFGNGEHVHFIDGADGGYALAAAQLKAQRDA